MKYHAIISMKDRCAVIRPLNHGVSDLEWHHGCRTYYLPSENKLDLEKDLMRKKMYDILDDNQWKDYIISLDDPTLVPNNNFVNSRFVPDKWDTRPEIY